MTYTRQVIKDPDERIKICQGCDNFIKMTTTCKICGCFMTFKVKFESVRCPLLKW